VRSGRSLPTFSSKISLQLQDTSGMDIGAASDAILAQREPTEVKRTVKEAPFCKSRYCRCKGPVRQLLFLLFLLLQGSSFRSHSSFQCSYSYRFPMGPSPGCHSLHIHATLCTSGLPFYPVYGGCTLLRNDTSHNFTEFFIRGGGSGKV
jgi:hypothetical protein